MRLVTLLCKFGTQSLTSLHSISFSELVCKISPTFSHLSELRDFFRDDSIDSLSGGLIKCLLQASQEETAMPCYLFF